MVGPTSTLLIHTSGNEKGQIQIFVVCARTRAGADSEPYMLQRRLSYELLVHVVVKYNIVEMAVT